MQIQEAELLISAPGKEQWPDTPYPEIVLAGRSNVGKSSLINALCNRKKLAYVGNTPGKTRLLNFFLLNRKLVFVDVPGYGYANISKQQLLRFGEMMEDYFHERKQKKALLLIVDGRHKPTDDDVTMLEFARYFELPIIIAATKMDKVKASQRQKQLKLISETLALSEEDHLIPCSSANKEGMDRLWEVILHYAQIEV
ncbi:ribosome biogenesis GTP-binding protein YihA/YsxC [Massilicoli timonensis]|uniref:ribosome biogenesis GTP-binding protein YihA/YsxC n=1 Tax=Massilicoli timonensis TaxID=2015901 RepID=UPI0015B3B453